MKNVSAIIDPRTLSPPHDVIVALSNISDGADIPVEIVVATFLYTVTKKELDVITDVDERCRYATATMIRQLDQKTSDEIKQIREGCYVART